MVLAFRTLTFSDLINYRSISSDDIKISSNEIVKGNRLVVWGYDIAIGLMAVEASPSPSGPEKPTLVSGPLVTNEHQAMAFAKLKALCEKDKLYWPASEIEGYPAEGRNDDNDLLYIVLNFDSCPRHLTYHTDGFLLHAHTIHRPHTNSIAPQQPGAGESPSCAHMITRRYRNSSV